MKLKPNYKVREIAGEKMVVMQGKDGVDLTKVILLNTSAEWLWNSLQGNDFSLDSAAQLLAERYTIGKEQAGTDAGKWIDSPAPPRLQRGGRSWSSETISCT